MKKTIFSTTILAAIAALAFTPFVSAHDMGSDDNPNFDYVDDQINDMHTDIIEELNEDGDLMGVIYKGTGAEEPTTAMGDGANSVTTTTQSGTQVLDAPGRGATSAARSGR
jgi:hypothetical protein